MNKNSKIYIAGHTGLVGSAILKKLKEKNYTNIITRTHDKLDLTNQSLVANFFKKEKPEYVILAAAKVGGIMANNLFRADFIYENISIQNNVIHQSYLHNVKKLLFLGSTCIYPKDAPQPIKESSLLTGPLEYTNEPYAIAKLAGIKMCESYNIQYNTNFISVMPTNLYGPNDNFDLDNSHVLPALIRKIHLAKLLNEEKYDEIMLDLGIDNIFKAKKYLKKYGITKNNVEIWGTGEPKREFLYSEDMADACIFLLKNKSFNDIVNSQSLSKSGEIKNTHINIGTGKDISIKELAYLIKDIVNFQGNFNFNTNKPDGVILKKTDITKLENMGWKYKITLREGIKKAYDFYTQNIK
ncbi:GDP-L-fucose synthase [Halarcobacter sp.]|uniref:GDP-L-fucose synthase family protein n=1 Tax=Halarcobacter sp. TaxID=2321133 RepID=UPI0029F46FD7|nr:GDP-L-fucose synthase [Halarcobacter sp.]